MMTLPIPACLMVLFMPEVMELPRPLIDVGEVDEPVGCLFWGWLLVALFGGLFAWVVGLVGCGDLFLGNMDRDRVFELGFLVGFLSMDGGWLFGWVCLSVFGIFRRLIFGFLEGMGVVIDIYFSNL